MAEDGGVQSAGRNDDDENEEGEEERSPDHLCGVVGTWVVDVTLKKRSPRSLSPSSPIDGGQLQFYSNRRGCPPSRLSPT